MTALRRSFDVAGRSRRREHWFFVAFCVLLFAAAAMIDVALGYGAMKSHAGHGRYGAGFSRSGPVETAVTLILLIPGLSASVRRLRDGDRRGWRLLIGFIPIVGATVLIVFFYPKKTRGADRVRSGP